MVSVEKKEKQKRKQLIDEFFPISTFRYTKPLGADLVQLMQLFRICPKNCSVLFFVLLALIRLLLGVYK